MVTKRTVYAGTCLQDDKLVCGVVEKQEYCDEDSWVPPHVVADSGHLNRICAYYPDTMVIGRCGPNGSCSNLASRCTDPASFIPRDPDCRITKDYGESGKYTTYGKCGDRCVWSPDDCLEGEEYVNDDMDCTANKVKLGACLDGFGYCTVSSKTCANTHDDSNTVEPYYTHDAFLEKFNTNCYLADLPKTLAPVAPTSPTFAPVPIPTVPPTNVVPINTSNLGNNGATQLSQNAIIGIVIGTTLPVGIALGFIAAKMRARTEPVAIAKQQEEDLDLPPMTIAVSISRDVVVDVNEELSIA